MLASTPSLYRDYRPVGIVSPALRGQGRDRASEDTARARRLCRALGRGLGLCLGFAPFAALSPRVGGPSLCQSRRQRERYALRCARTVASSSSGYGTPQREQAARASREKASNSPGSADKTESRSADSR